MKKIGLDPDRETGLVTPPCVEQGVITCRGCAGWIFMRQAFADPDSSWRVIHCPAVGLTLERGKNKKAVKAE